MSSIQLKDDFEDGVRYFGRMLANVILKMHHEPHRLPSAGQWSSDQYAV